MGKQVPIVDVPPTFSDALRGRFVLQGEASSWILPEINIGSAALAEVMVVP